MKWREKGSRLYRKFVLGEHVEDLNKGGNVANELKYPQSAVEAFPQGVRLDLRTRLAIEFLKTPLAAEYLKGLEAAAVEDLRAAADGQEPPVKLADRVAGFALDVAESLMFAAEQRGWTAPMPETDELDASTKRQARRNARFQCEQQVAGNRAMQEMAAGAIATPQGARMPS